MENMQTIGSFILRYVREHNLTLNELSRKTKIAHSTLDRWIAGTSTPGIRQLSALASFTETDICYLVTLIVPDGRREIGATADDLAKRIRALPEDRQQFIDTLLLGIAVQYADKKPKGG